MLVIANEQYFVTAKNDATCTIAYDHNYLFKYSKPKLSKIYNNSILAQKCFLRYKVCHFSNALYNYLYEKDGKTYNCTPTAGRIDLVSDVNGYTEENFPTGKRPANWDTDLDGMPDEWETANELDPNDASDAKTYTLDSKGWYTNIEVYANSLVEDIMKAGNADAESSVDEYYPAIPSRIEKTQIHLVSKIEYFSVDGRQVDTPQSGISIRKMTLSNGKTITDKVIKK